VGVGSVGVGTVGVGTVDLGVCQGRSGLVLGEGGPGGVSEVCAAL